MKWTLFLDALKRCTLLEDLPISFSLLEAQVGDSGRERPYMNVNILAMSDNKYSGICPLSQVTYADTVMTKAVVISRHCCGCNQGARGTPYS